MFYQLPPVGNPLKLAVETGAVSVLDEANTRYYGSGTAALAAAIVAAIKVTSQIQNTVSGVSTDESNAEIILPAYACPDLLSAVVCAGAKPVLVDLEKDKPWLDPEQLRSSITHDTVAIVAVNLFGVSENWQQLRSLADEFQLVLIEDSAQYFPGYKESVQWQGDFVVISFGRGKPVSLLGGGAVITNDRSLGDKLDGSLVDQLEIPEKSANSVVNNVLFKFKARLYNAMISPYLYWLPQALPFLHLGETRYHTLHEIDAIAQHNKALLVANISCYQADRQAYQRCERLSKVLDSVSQLVNLPRECGVDGYRRLLRYPVLVDADKRDLIVEALNKAGLGASVLYPSSLPKISGVEPILDNTQNFVNAEVFARRLITLPVHAGVRQRDIDKMATILKELAQ